APADPKAAPPEPVKAERPAVERPRPVITTEERGAPKAQAPSPPHKTEVKPLVKRSDAPGPQAAAPAQRAGDRSASAEELRRTKSSPLVRKIAEEYGIDVKQLEGTGMSGRVTKNDILSFIESGSAPQAAPAPATSGSKLAPQGTSVTRQTPAARPSQGDRAAQVSGM